MRACQRARRSALPAQRDRQQDQVVEVDGVARGEMRDVVGVDRGLGALEARARGRRRRPACGDRSSSSRSRPPRRATSRAAAAPRRRRRSAGAATRAAGSRRRWRRRWRSRRAGRRRARPRGGCAGPGGGRWRCPPWRRRGPRLRRRARLISFAARLVKVTAKICSGARPRRSRWTIFAVMTRVLPDPAPASTSMGTSLRATAALWAGFNRTFGSRGAGGARSAEEGLRGRVRPAFTYRERRTVTNLVRWGSGPGRTVGAVVRRARASAT